MTQAQQPEALRLAAICETKGMFPVADELNRMHARILELEQGKCLHQIAEPAAYPHLPQSVADVLDFMDGSKVDVDFSQPAPTGGTPLYTADQMRAYVDADRAQGAAAPQAVQPVAPQLKANCYSDDNGDYWRDCPDDCDFVEGLKVGDTYELQASIRAWSETFRVTKAPDETSDDYEVELVSSDAPAHPAEGVPAQDMVSVKKEDANAFCRILTALGMEEEGDPVAEVQRLLAATQPAADAVVSIYVTAGGEREFNDWKVPLSVGRNLLYTQPAAQELDAPESEYRRGYRHGYNRRDAEVKGALA